MDPSIRQLFIDWWKTRSQMAMKIFEQNKGESVERNFKKAYMIRHSLYNIKNFQRKQ